MTLAARCASSHNYIAEIESGRRFPSVEKIETLAAALSIEPHLLFMPEAETREETKETKTPHEYLRKMPRSVKRELAGRLVRTLQAEIRTSVDKSLDPKNYR